MIYFKYKDLSYIKVTNLEEVYCYLIMGLKVNYKTKSYCLK